MEDFIDREPGRNEGIRVTYKHKRIMRFAVGKFEFKNHLLVLTNEKDIAEFEEIYKTLQIQDQNSIVQLKVEENEMAVGSRPSRAVRGAVGTTDIPDKTNPVPAAAIQPAPQEPATPAPMRSLAPNFRPQT